MSRPPENLSFVQAVRKRPAMYIGSTSMRGVYFLLRQFVRYAFTVARSDYFSFEILSPESGRITVDLPDGPVDESTFTDPPLVEWSGRTVDFELAALNALCSSFHVKQVDLRSGSVAESRFALGFLAFGPPKYLERGPSRMEIDFKLDESIFSSADHFNSNILLEALRTLGYLYPGKALRLAYPAGGEGAVAIFKFDRGLGDLIALRRLNENVDPKFESALDHTFDDFSIDLAFHFLGTSVDMPYLISFVNEERSMEDGTHVEGVLRGLLAALINYQNESGESVEERLTTEGIARMLVVAVHLRMDRPMFEGAIRGKVISRNIAGPLANFIGDRFLAQLKADPEQANDLVRQVARESRL